MIKYLTKTLLPPRSFVPLLHLPIRYSAHAPHGTRRLDLYKKIKQKQMRGIRDNTLNQQSISKFYKQMRCDGCNSVLQSQDKYKYGFINKQIFERSVQGNIKLIENTYGQKIGRSDSKTLQIISQVQNQLGVKIFNNRTKKLDNLDNYQVLLRLQQKIDKYEQQQQTIKRIKKQRTELYCVRCYSLKFYNKLPDEYDIQDHLPQNNQEHLMTKVIKKHQNAPSTLFLYILDILDIAGSFKSYVFHRLLQADVQFCIVVNKLDIVNDKYLNKHIIYDVVRSKMMEFIQGNQESQKIKLKQKVKNVKILLCCSTNKIGIKSLEHHLQKNSVKRIQLIGFPNCGKTTLLNQLGRSNKPTSKVPGTTLFITEHFNKKSVIYDMPGMFSEQNLCNKVSRPNLKGLLTWNKFYSPPVMLHQAFFYGGKVEIKNVKIILFGLGGACASDNRWFVLNYKQFWKGLPSPQQMNIQRHTITLTFIDGKSKDLQIAGWGFISFRLAIHSKQEQKKELTLYLPEGISFALRNTILKDSEVLNYRSVVTKRHRLQRMHKQKQKQFKQMSKNQ